MECKILYLVFNILLFCSLSLQEHCFNPLGMGDGRIKSDQISVTKPHRRWYGKEELRLTEENSVWMPANQSVGQYVQIDLLQPHVITGVATQGKNQTYLLYITSFRITYGFDGKNFIPYKDSNGKPKVFAANKEVYEKKINHFYPPVMARYFRLYPLTWRRKLCLKMELYGCKASNCSVDNGGCPETCIQVDDYSVKCGCHKAGYKYIDGKCQDIDECLQHPCDHDCKNTDGSFQCRCKQGFVLGADGTSCTDINECNSDVKLCHQGCENTHGSYKCKCYKGYEFSNDRYTCIDINECDRGNGGCDHNCTNSVGSFSCSCHSGYKLYYGKKCRDVDECDLDRPTHKCEQFCKNTQGGYYCECAAGYNKNADGYHCDDINECDTNNGGCSDECVNSIGSYICKCPKGYKLHYLGRTCHDINECTPENGNGNCEHICDNLPGNYSCRCKAGYELQSDRTSCRDLDECARSNLNLCDKVSTNCINTQPSYRCECKKGFEPKKGISLSCTSIKCNAIPKSSTYAVSPSSCFNGHENVYNTVCKFKCMEGYELVDNGASMVAKCLSNRQWDTSPPQCQGVKCPSIPKRANGQLDPPECATGIRYPNKCILSCDPGHVHSGPSTVTCQNDGSFSIDGLSKFVCVKDIPRPQIYCRHTYSVDLPLGKNSVELPDNWFKDVISTSLGTIKCSRPNNYRYPVGDTIVTFTATATNGEKDSCNLTVRVSDKEAPTIVYCPKERIHVKIDASNKWVKWQVPHFTDNVGVVSVKADKEFGNIAPGDYTIGYTAIDASGNKNRDCNINLVVTEDNPCSHDHIIPSPGTRKHCRGTRCLFQCLSQRMFYNDGSRFLVFQCDTTTGWGKDILSIPECVGFTESGGDECPPGTEVTDTKCVNCPTGMYSDGKCKKCPIGEYQDVQKSTSCMKCPDGYGTYKPGANVCKELCKKGYFGTPTGTCSPCPIGTYQPDNGKSSCISCPVGTITRTTGSINQAQCGRVGKITLEPGKNVSINVGDNVEFLCKSTAIPLDMQWEKEKLIQGPSGVRPGERPIIEDGKVIGKTYRIRSATTGDRGYYICKTQNVLGKNEEKLYLNVKIDTIVVDK